MKIYSKCNLYMYVVINAYFNQNSQTNVIGLGGYYYKFYMDCIYHEHKCSNCKRYSCGFDSHSGENILSSFFK